MSTVIQFLMKSKMLPTFFFHRGWQQINRLSLFSCSKLLYGPLKIHYWLTSNPLCVCVCEWEIWNGRPHHQKWKLLYSNLKFKQCQDWFLLSNKMFGYIPPLPQPETAHHFHRKTERCGVKTGWWRTHSLICVFLGAASSRKSPTQASQPRGSHSWGLCNENNMLCPTPWRAVNHVLSIITMSLKIYTYGSVSSSLWSQ